MTDETTPQDGKAMSSASAGSQPFWAWWSHDLGIGHFADIKSRAIAYRDAGCGEIFPIYRQPQPALTDEERAFLELRANRLYSQAKQTLAEEERMRFRTALADAIRRPMGVIPESAEGLVTQDDLDAAEKRRAK